MTKTKTAAVQIGTKVSYVGVTGVKFVGAVESLKKIGTVWYADVRYPHGLTPMQPVRGLTVEH